VNQKAFHEHIMKILMLHGSDPEALHSALDKAMEEQLIYYGHRDTIALIRKQTRWYA
jgi:hypothetical protein